MLENDRFPQGAMKLGRETKGIPSTDLLVCFPSRSHLALMPSFNKLRTHRCHHWKRKPTKSPAMGSEILEPSSPKVSCAGQIKIRPKNNKSWRVMEEIERIHNRRKLRTQRFNWVESFGFKKDIMQFLTCLCSIRFDFRCFRAFPEVDFTTEEEEEEVEGIESSITAFSKWFMVLQENGVGRERNHLCTVVVDGGSIEPPMAVPPKNALLLMRCRSAPAKRWLEVEEEVKVKKSLKWLMEEENRESLVMEMGPELCRISSDIGKETWVVGEKSRDLFSRSRSWKV